MKADSGDEWNTNCCRSQPGHVDFRGASIRVLLVDDNRLNQIVASNFLIGLGIAVDIANNGKEALEMIQCKVYNLVLMDLQMPVMDGYAAALSIRALNTPYFKEVPIIALSGSPAAEVREKVLEVGMSDFMSKPFLPAELQATVRKFVLGRMESPALQHRF